MAKKLLGRCKKVCSFQILGLVSITLFSYVSVFRSLRSITPAYSVFAKRAWHENEGVPIPPFSSVLYVAPVKPQQYDLYSAEYL